MYKCTVKSQLIQLYCKKALGPLKVVSAFIWCLEFYEISLCMNLLALNQNQLFSFQLKLTQSTNTTVSTKLNVNPKLLQLSTSPGFVVSLTIAWVWTVSPMFAFYSESYLLDTVVIKLVSRNCVIRSQKCGIRSQKGGIISINVASKFNALCSTHFDHICIFQKS